MDIGRGREPRADYSHNGAQAPIRYSCGQYCSECYPSRLSGPPEPSAADQCQVDACHLSAQSQPPESFSDACNPLIGADALQCTSDMIVANEADVDHLLSRSLLIYGRQCSMRASMVWGLFIVNSLRTKGVNYLEINPIIGKTATVNTLTTFAEGQILARAYAAFLAHPVG